MPDKPIFVPKRRTPPGAEKDADPVDTKQKILDAAFRCLASEGYAALSIREIAKEAGVNSALINYHFGTKEQLVIDVLDAANQRLLARQAAMYERPISAAEKWAQASAFYDDDLASGFVRVQSELLAASMANESLRAKFLPRVVAWRQLIEAAAQESLLAFEASGGRLPPFLSAEVLATWIGHFWVGLELVDLIGGPSERARGRTAVNAVQSLLALLDKRTGTPVEKQRAGKGRFK